MNGTTHGRPRQGPPFHWDLAERVFCVLPPYERDMVECGRIRFCDHDLRKEPHPTADGAHANSKTIANFSRDKVAALRYAATADGTPRRRAAIRDQCRTGR